MENIESVLKWSSFVLTVGLCLRLWREGLHRDYRWFWRFLAFETVRSVPLVLMKPATNAYAIFYMGSEVLVWALYFLILRELYALILADHPGLQTAGLQVLYLSLAVAVAVSVGWAVKDLGGPRQEFWVLQVFFIFGRVVSGTILLLLVAITGFLVWFPVRLRRNLVHYAVGFLIFFLGKTSVLMARNVLGPSLTEILSSLNLLLPCAVLGFWLVRLNRAGQEKSAGPGEGWGTADREKLIRQLEAINRAVLRSSAAGAGVVATDSAETRSRAGEDAP